MISVTSCSANVDTYRGSWQGAWYHFAAMQPAETLQWKSATGGCGFWCGLQKTPLRWATSECRVLDGALQASLRWRSTLHYAKPPPWAASIRKCGLQEAHYGRGVQGRFLFERIAKWNKHDFLKRLGGKTKVAGANWPSSQITMMSSLAMLGSPVR